METPWVLFLWVSRFYVLNGSTSIPIINKDTQPTHVLNASYLSLVCSLVHLSYISVHSLPLVCLFISDTVVPFYLPVERMLQTKLDISQALYTKYVR